MRSPLELRLDLSSATKDSLARKHAMIKRQCWLGAKLLAAYVLIATPLSGCQRQEKGTTTRPTGSASKEPSLLLLSDPKGTVAPCGCTSKPLGGLAKLSTLSATLGHPPLITVGDTAFDTETLDPTRRSQEEEKAKLVVDIYKSLNWKAAWTGTIEQRLDEGGWPQRLGYPLVKTDEVLELTPKVNLGLLASSRIELGERAAKLRQKGVLAVIAISDLAMEQAQRESWPGIDIVLTRQCTTQCLPRERAGVTFVGATERGQRAAVLRFFPVEASTSTASSQSVPPTLAYFDAGQGERIAIKRQLEALDKQRQTLKSDHPTRQLLDERSAELTADLKALEQTPPKPPQRSYFSVELVALDNTMADDPMVKKKVAAYDSRLCEWSKASFERVTCNPAKEGEASFVGSKTCQGCHMEAYTTWKATKHAHAFDTLEQAGKTCDLGCIGCHTVGFSKPGGFCKPLEVGELKDVGCENCHGPGSLHAQGKAKLERFVSEQTCRECHTPEHSDLFAYDTYRPKLFGPGHQSKAPPPLTPSPHNTHPKQEPR